MISRSKSTISWITVDSDSFSSFLLPLFLGGGICRDLKQTRVVKIEIKNRKTQGKPNEGTPTKTRWHVER